VTPRTYLWDVREAADAIASFTQGRSFVDYAEDLMFRSAVERQRAIIGEALSQLARVDQGLAVRIPELRRVIAFRNVLIHGYDQIDDAGVWRIVEADLAPLRGRIAALLVELGSLGGEGMLLDVSSVVRRQMTPRNGRSRRRFIPNGNNFISQFP
jgi:uncharacterized protein with HEPN domain